MPETTLAPWTPTQERLGGIAGRIMTALNVWVFRLTGGRLGGTFPGGALGLVAIGLVARAFGLRVAMGVSGAVFVLVAPGFVLLGRAARRVALPEAMGEPVPVVATKVSPTALG